MLVEQQIAERRERARDSIAKILERPSNGPYGDYRIKSASGKTYRAAMRGPGLFENYCSCPDFAVNTLGTCKHIEALLLRLRKRHGPTLESKAYARARASISLQYGETIDVRLRLPAAPSPALRKLAGLYFDSAGLLRQRHFRSFHEVIEAFRKADLEAVVYSDVIESPAAAALSPAGATAASEPASFERAAAGLIETGVRFLESLAAVARSAPDGSGLSSLLSRDPRTRRPVLSIPLPESVDQSRIMQAISALLGSLGRPA